MHAVTLTAAHDDTGRGCIAAGVDAGSRGGDDFSCSGSRSRGSLAPQHRDIMGENDVRMCFGGRHRAARRPSNKGNCGSRCAVAGTVRSTAAQGVSSLCVHPGIRLAWCLHGSSADGEA